MFVEINNICKKFGEKIAVNNFNINIEKGELLSILGPSGCGKTTTLKVIGGFYIPESGEIVIDGEDITRLPANLRPTATVFQSYALFPNMNVIKNVTYGLKFRKIKKRDSVLLGEDMLKAVGLFDYRNWNVNKLSGGQQQRVALARAIVLNPKVLLLDEPLSNLDAKLRVKMREEIKAIQKKFQVTMIFVTHDQEEAMSISDRIAVMNNGEIQQIGAPKEVYTNPINKFVADFIGRINIIKLNGVEQIVRPEKIVLDKNIGEYDGVVLSKQYKGVYTTYYINSGFGILQADYFGDYEIKPEDKIYFSIKKCDK